MSTSSESEHPNAGFAKRLADRLNGKLETLADATTWFRLTRDHTRSPAPPPSPAADQLVLDLFEAGKASGLNNDEPMLPILRALTATILFLDSRVAESDKALADAVQRVISVLDLSINSAAAEEKRLESSAKLIVTRSLDALGNGFVKTVDAGLLKRNQLLCRNIGLMASFVLFAVTISGIGGGYVWGRNTTTGEIVAMVGKIQIPLGDNIVDARLVSKIFTLNSMAAAIRLCQNTSGQHFLTITGVLGCNVTVYLEPQKQPVQVINPS